MFKKYERFVDSKNELAAEFEAAKENAQAQYARSESKIFADVYTDACVVIAEYAELHDLTLVIRFNGQSIDYENADPKKLANRLNRLIIYHRPDYVITDDVIEILNKRYADGRNGDGPTESAVSKLSEQR